MSAVCPHVPYDAEHAVAVGQLRHRPDAVQVRCPCCNLRGWRDPDDDLEGDRCPYCWEQAVPA